MVRYRLANFLRARGAFEPLRLWGYPFRHDRSGRPFLDRARAGVPEEAHHDRQSDQLRRVDPAHPDDAQGQDPRAARCRAADDLRHRHEEPGAVLAARRSATRRRRSASRSRSPRSPASPRWRARPSTSRTPTTRPSCRSSTPTSASISAGTSRPASAPRPCWPCRSCSRSTCSAWCS